MDRYGKPVPGLRELGLTHTFPLPEVLAEAKLTDVGLSRPRAAAIRGFAAATADGTIRLDRSVSLEHLVNSIDALPGMGEADGHYVAFRLGEPDAFPLSDRQLAGRLQMRGDPAPEMYASERWRPWRALARTHLWLADGIEPSAHKGVA